MPWTINKHAFHMHLPHLVDHARCPLLIVALLLFIQVLGSQGRCVKGENSWENSLVLGWSLNTISKLFSLRGIQGLYQGFEGLSIQ